MQKFLLETWEVIAKRVFSSKLGGVKENQMSLNVPEAVEKMSLKVIQKKY
jgi:hypothetical protein